MTPARFMTEVDLSGTWRATDASEHLHRDFCDPDFADDDWRDIEVPSHWQSQSHFAQSTGPLLFRRHFEVSAHPGSRSWLVFDGVYSRASVWVDGGYSGEIDEYFAPVAFEITDALTKRGSHIAALEVTSPTELSPWSKGNWGPGGIWRGVRVVRTGLVRIARLKVLCIEATEERAVLSIYAELDAGIATKVHVRTLVTPTEGTTHPGTEHEMTQALAAKTNRLQWTVVVDEPRLWWPWEIGNQPLFNVNIEVSESSDNHNLSDHALARTGLRHVSYEKGFFAINGERLFLKNVFADVGADAPAETSPSKYEASLRESKDAGGNLVYVPHWVEPNSFYDAADCLGMLVWQGAPIMSRIASEPASAKLARQATEILGHHPSVIAWIRRPKRLRNVRPKADPLKRTFGRADPSRPTLELPEGWRFFKFTDADVRDVIPKWAKRSRFVYFESEPRATPGHIDVIRTFKYRPVGGFIARLAVPELLDGACDPVRLVVELPQNIGRGESADLSVRLINDLRAPIREGVVTASIASPHKNLKWSWAGEIEADDVAYIGTMRVPVPAQAQSLTIKLELASPSVKTARTITVLVK